MALRSEKVSETQVNETLYRNVIILSQLYPAPNKELQNVLKKDMFVKNNRTAFIHVSYYLLYLLDPKRIHEKIKSWPIFDSQYERQFRAEVAKYLNELNEIYVNANMPSIMASQLVSPGGVRFAKYMLKLSILVMSQCLEKNKSMQEKMLVKPNVQKSGTEADSKIKKINLLTSHINKESQRKIFNFQNKFTEYKQIANSIMKKLKEIRHDMALLQEKVKVQSTRVQDCNNLQSDEKLEVLVNKLTKIKENNEKLSKMRDLLTYLTKIDLPLKMNIGEELNLISWFENFNLEMRKHCLEMRTFTDLELNHYMEKFSKCNEKLGRLMNNWIQVHIECMKVFEEFRSSNSRAVGMDNQTSASLCSSDSTALAIPLESSNSE